MTTVSPKKTNNACPRCALLACILTLSPASAESSTTEAPHTVNLVSKTYASGFRIVPLLLSAKALDEGSVTGKNLRRILTISKRAARDPGTRFAAAEFSAKLPQTDLAREWNWFAGLYALDTNDPKDAEDRFRSVRKSDSNYLRAQYQIAIMELKANRTRQAQDRLKRILASKPAPENDLENLTKLALGRIWYEQKKFKSSAAVYRTIDRSSQWFENALFEQSWSFFMAGYPNHALGALHGAGSPFFEKTFNPEVPLLKSMILYWMCLYRDSNLALEEFIARHSGPMDDLEKFLARQRLDARSGWELFENYIAGVSSESLGIDHHILHTAAESDAMIPIRRALAKAMDEKNILTNTNLQAEIELQLLDTHIAGLRRKAGATFVNALQSMRDHYGTLRAQADFLYVELLTSEKDKLMGKNDHLATDKFNQQRKTGKRPAGWGRRLVAWAPSDKDEYWWDEIGYYIDPAKPNCKK